MISEKDPTKQYEKIEDIRKWEQESKEKFQRDLEELRALQTEARDITKLLNIKLVEALILLCLREIRQVHYHEDQKFKVE
jgi:hypothetical protein